MSSSSSSSSEKLQGHQQSCDKSPLPPTAHVARAILSMAFGWVFIRGFQLRDEIIFPAGLVDHDYVVTSTLIMATRTTAGEEINVIKQDTVPGNPRRLLRSRTSETDTTTTTLKSKSTACCLWIQDDEFHLADWLAHHSMLEPTLDYVMVGMPFPYQPLRLNNNHQNKNDMKDITLDGFTNELDLTIVSWTNGDDTDAEATADTNLDLAQTFKDQCAQIMKESQHDSIIFHDSIEYLPNDWKESLVEHYGIDKVRRLGL